MPVRLNGDYYGTKGAATALERSEGRVRQMIRWGLLEAVEVSPRSWLIPKAEVSRVLKERGKVATQ